MINKNVIIFSSIDWNMHKQLHHQLTYSLLKNGNRILYIENSGVRRITIKDYSRIITRIKNWFNSVGGYQENIKNLTILVSLIFPFPYSKFFTFLNKHIIYNRVQKWLKFSQISKPIIITFLPTPLVHALLNKINHEFLIYYCANNMPMGSKYSLPLIKWEKLMFKKSDIIISISNDITEKAKKINLNVKKIPPGVDDIFFKNTKSLKLEDIINIKKPIIGYIGAVSDVLDYELIEYLIKNLKEISFVFVGPIYTNKINNFNKYKNIYFLGNKSHDLIPHYIKYFDVAIIPYLVNDFTNSVYCCKLNEYLASGKPVVSTYIKENYNFNNLNRNIIKVSKSKKEFENDILYELQNNNESLIKERKTIAFSNSWEKRYLELNDYVDKKLSKKQQGNLKNDKFSFLILYQKSRTYLKKTVLTLTVIFLIIFYSPIFWFLGNNLDISQNKEETDSIVVFSGNDSKYSDKNYLNLVLRAKNLYDQNLSKNIILISGKEQTIREVDVMKLFLVNKGVPSKDVYVFNNYPESTYMGIKMINEVLEKKNMSKIIYLSSKYHNLRSKLIWDKNFPNKKIIFLKPSSKKNKKYLFWTSTYQDIKLIIYEYLSIIYNKFKGRL